MANKWFGTDGVRGKANVFPMTANFAFNLAQAAGQLICTTKRKVAIGKDTRRSGDMLEAAMAAGFMAQGVDVILLGVLPTPAVTTITPELGVDMSVMITASHNPYQDNGIKLISASGDKFSDEITAELEAAVEKNEFSLNPEAIGTCVNDDSAIEKYKTLALSMAGKKQPLQGLKVVLDCANGCFSDILPEVFNAFGAQVITFANQPDGQNINRDCGSMHPEKMMKLVVENGADLGIAVDGDGDRIIVSNEKGEKINSEQIMAFLAEYMHSTGELKGRAVVSTVLSNTGLESFIRDMGIDYYSTPVGERHVVVKMQEVGGVVGGEESGHIVISDYSRTGDALMVALVLARGILARGKKMTEIFPIFAMEPMIFVNPRFASREDVREIAANPELKALIAECNQQIVGQGRVFIHPSGTEPLIRVWVSGKNAELVENIGRRLLAKIKSFGSCMTPDLEVKLLFTSKV